MKKVREGYMRLFTRQLYQKRIGTVLGAVGTYGSCATSLESLQIHIYVLNAGNKTYFETLLAFNPSIWEELADGSL